MHTHSTHPYCISPWANPSFDLGSAGPCLLCVLCAAANMEQDGRLLFERWERGDKVKKKKWIEARVQRLQGFISWTEPPGEFPLPGSEGFTFCPRSTPSPSWRGVERLKPSTEVARLRFFDWHGECSYRFIGFWNNNTFNQVGIGASRPPAGESFPPQPSSTLSFRGYAIFFNTEQEKKPIKTPFSSPAIPKHWPLSVGTTTSVANWEPHSLLGLPQCCCPFPPSPTIVPPFQRAIVEVVPRGPLGEDI